MEINISSVNYANPYQSKNSNSDKQNKDVATKTSDSSKVMNFRAKK